VHKLKTLSQME